jgi:uncharacterized protein
VEKIMSKEIIEQQERAKENFSKYLDLQANNQMEQFKELWADDAVVEFPYAPPSLVARIEGKEAIFNYYKDTPNQFTNWKFTISQFYETLNPSVILIEWHGNAEILATGQSYDQTYIGYLQMKDNKIVYYKEYWNPIIVLEAFGDTQYLGETFNVTNA